MALVFGMGSVEWGPWSGNSWLCLLLLGLIYLAYTFELRQTSKTKVAAA